MTPSSLPISTRLSRSCPNIPSNLSISQECSLSSLSTGGGKGSCSRWLWMRCRVQGQLSWRQNRRQRQKLLQRRWVVLASCRLSTQGRNYRIRHRMLGSQRAQTQCRLLLAGEGTGEGIDSGMGSGMGSRMGRGGGESQTAVAVGRDLKGDYRVVKQGMTMGGMSSGCSSGWGLAFPINVLQYTTGGYGSSYNLIIALHLLMVMNLTKNVQSIGK